jgi:hypothetical protein
VRPIASAGAAMKAAGWACSLSWKVGIDRTEKGDQQAHLRAGCLVVGDDVTVRHPEIAEQKCGNESGAVFAGRGVEPCSGTLWAEQTM